MPAKKRSRFESAASSRAMRAGSAAARALLSADSSARWKRPRSSEAALRVKVTAAMCSTWYTPVATPAAMRSASICVLPEPAPASTRMFSSRRSRMVSREAVVDGA